MKNIFILLFILTCFKGFVVSQTIYNLDDYWEEAQNTDFKAGLLKTQKTTDTEILSYKEVQNIHYLTSTINAVIYQYGELVNIAKERNVPCVKADADVSTFIQFTSSNDDKKKLLATCQNVQLVRFSLYADADFEQAKYIDFTILKQFPKLQYIVFYVSPIIYKQPSEALQREQIKSRLKTLMSDWNDLDSIKVVYSIPQAG